MTRAELRRLAQASPAGEAIVETPAPMPAAASRRRTRPTESAAVLDDTADVVDLADLEPEALAIPVVEAPPFAVAMDVPHPASAADVPVTEASVAASAEPSPAVLPTSPITLPAARRRLRERPVRETLDETPAFELLTPTDATGGPIAVAAAAADEDSATDTAPTRDDARMKDTVDEFEVAARLFAFTGETPVQVAADALVTDADDEADAEPSHASGRPRRRRLLSFKRVATASFSVGVFGVVGLLAVGMTTPVGAVAAAQGADAVKTNLLTASDVASDDEEIQAYVAPADVQAGALDRTDGFEAATLADLAADSGITNFSSFFVNDPTAAIQWPFAVGVPITYGFGMRSGTMHEGADFVPGAGAPVQAIADGTVRIATESGGAYGVTVVIDHVIDGELVSSRYAHMQYDSLTVSPGDAVTVGTVIGHTGNTGRSYGAHTHFEILAGGTTAIDPIPWLREHAGG
ncbi:peptidoglycan DD-metalloendopeptidase family protein [Microbacterium sp. P07]|uniref:M23 family metallopeptidase n=1 Tax=Microbacterium sp. P07 TaxID=3366952 RepID=UPI00374668D0